MPITQDRMLALISAAADYQQALQRACKFVSDAQHSIRLGADPIETVEELAGLIKEAGLLRNPLKSHSTILLEEQHFKKEKHKNIRHKQRAQARREAEGIVSRQTAPMPKQVLDEIAGESESEVFAAASKVAEKIRTKREFGDIPASAIKNIDAEVEIEVRQQEYLEEKKKESPEDKSTLLYDPPDEDDNSSPLIGSEEDDAL